MKEKDEREGLERRMREKNMREKNERKERQSHASQKMRNNLVNISALSARRFDESVVVGESGDMKRGPAANAVFDAEQSLSAVLCQFHHSICNPFLVCKMSIEGVVFKQNLASCKAHCTPRSQSVQGCGPDDDDQRCKYSLTKPIIRTKKKREESRGHASPRVVCHIRFRLGPQQRSHDEVEPSGCG